MVSTPKLTQKIANFCDQTIENNNTITKSAYDTTLAQTVKQ